MRGLTAPLVLSLLISGFSLAPAGCQQRRSGAASMPGSAVAGMISVADPNSSAQLVSGFYEVESGAWRWTAKSFDVMLRPPRGAASNGALLVLRFAIPEVVIERLKSVSVSANVNGARLETETYTSTGDLMYTREVPSSALNADTVTVRFTLDKALPPRQDDGRELGIIAKEVGFEVK